MKIISFDRNLTLKYSTVFMANSISLFLNNVQYRGLLEARDAFYSEEFYKLQVKTAQVGAEVLPACRELFPTLFPVSSGSCKESRREEEVGEDIWQDAEALLKQGIVTGNLKDMNDGINSLLTSFFLVFSKNQKDAKSKFTIIQHYLPLLCLTPLDNEKLNIRLEKLRQKFDAVVDKPKINKRYVPKVTWEEGVALLDKADNLASNTHRSRIFKDMITHVKHDENRKSAQERYKILLAYFKNLAINAAQRDEIQYRLNSLKERLFEPPQS